MIRIFSCCKGRIPFVVMVLSCVVFSQEKRLAKADKKFADYAFISARKAYLNMVKSGYTSAAIYKKLGDSYYFNAELKNALLWYDKLMDEYAEAADPEYLFSYSQSLKSAARYEEADAIMEKFRTLTNKDGRAVLFMGMRDYLGFIKLQSGGFEIRKSGINSKYSEYAPSYDYRGYLVFTSSRLGNTISKNRHQWNDMPFSDVFSIAENAINDSVYRPKKLKGKINTRFHESSTAFSKDGKTVYFTRNNYMGTLRSNKEGTVLLKLYRATLHDAAWKNIEELPFNSDVYSVAHPALSPDGKKLYFASDMPGSKGMSDLYVVEIHEDGTFGLPRNLGKPINTEARETFPYVSASGKLYFSGDGHLGLGGLDIFVAEPKEDGSFSTPYNVGKPVNSSADDFSFILDEHTKTGYFASNRSGGMGSDDIYRVFQTGRLTNKVKEDYEPFDAAFLSHADFEYQNQFPLQLRKKKDPDAGADLTMLLGSIPRFDATKNYKERYPPFEATFMTHADFEQQNQFPLQLHKKNRFKAGTDLAKLLGIIIHFDTAKSDIRPDAATQLQKLIKVLRENPELKIDIRSHTDSRASSRYNLALSERRVQSTITHLVETGGIDASRITGRGYGERQLLNECKDGVPCSDKKHQLNRRSAFIVVE